MTFRVNTPDVIEETVEGEVIIVHLMRGSYYSLRGSGAAIWDAILAGLDEDAVTSRFAGPAAPNREEVAAAIRRFIGQLQAEALIVPGEPARPIAGAGDRRQAPEGVDPFTEPVIEKYSDMQELLLLDPIHDVDASGWPSTKGTTDG